MRNIRLMTAAVLCALCASAVSLRAQATSRQLLNLQGRLTDNSGSCLTGTYSFTLGIFSVSSGGVALYSDTQATVPVTSGIYNIELGAGTGGAIPASVFNDPDLYIEIAINGETLTPRTHLTSAAFAFNADSLDGLDSTAFAPATGSANYAPSAGSGTYVAKAGDTMTGALALPADGLTLGTNQLVAAGGTVMVGTSTVDPGAPLQVAASGGGKYVHFKNATGGVPYGFRLTAPDRDWILIASEAGTPAGSLSILDNTASTARLVVDTAGNVGIGNNSPAAKLDVAGTGNFTGTVSAAAPTAGGHLVTKTYADATYAPVGGAAGYLSGGGGSMSGPLSITSNASSGAWASTSTTGAPQKRVVPTATWTGSKMIIWGGIDSLAGTDLDTGGVYDPATDVWTATSTTGAPTKRRAHRAVWTGSKMIVWGGQDDDSAPISPVRKNDGGIYDPATDTWTATSTTGAPTNRDSHTAVWTGTEMIVWGGDQGGGSFTNTGGKFDPVANTWTGISATGAPVGRMNHFTVWTGSKMIVWGGNDPGGTNYNTGGVYDPSTDTWTTTSTTGAPAARGEGTVALWTGTRMLVWGGGASGGSPAYGDGAAYDPVTNTWTPISAVGAPSARIYSLGVWTGAQVIVWGGNDGAGSTLSDGAAYDPVTDTWMALPTSGAPAGRSSHSGVWAGTRMILFSGTTNTLGSGLTTTGGRFSPGGTGLNVADNVSIGGTLAVGATLTAGSLNVTGSTSFAGTVSAANPTLGTHLVTRNYADTNYASAAGYVAKAGDTMTGMLTADGGVGSSAATTLSIDSGTTGTLNIGTGDSAKTINIGTGSTTVQDIAIGNGGAADANFIRIGSVGGASTILVGDTLGSSSTNIRCGTAGGSITIGESGAAAQTLNLGTGTLADTINVGTSGADTITIGNASATSVSITDDNWSVTAAGTATFAGTVSAAAPTLGGHLVTRTYADATYAPISGGGNYLAKGTADTSSASVAGILYDLANTDGGATAGMRVHSAAGNGITAQVTAAPLAPYASRTGVYAVVDGSQSHGLFARNQGGGGAGTGQNGVTAWTEAAAVAGSNYHAVEGYAAQTATANRAAGVVGYNGTGFTWPSGFFGVLGVTNNAGGVAGHFEHTTGGTALEVVGTMKVTSATPSPGLFIRSEDTNFPQGVLRLVRTRSSATAPGAGFGPQIKFQAEGFTDNDYDLDTSIIESGWEVPQTNNTTDRDGFVSFWTMLDSTIGEKARITSAGNMGIGTASPAAKLDVAGTGNFTGTVSAAAPTAAGHLATKGYVDTTAANTVPTGSVVFSQSANDAGLIANGFARVDGSVSLSTGSWSATTTTGAPTNRSQATAVWTGTKLLVWGGIDNATGLDLDTGAAYDPVANSWTAITTTGAPTKRRGHSAVWTGSRMIIWGGQDDDAAPIAPVRKNDGGVYDPVGDSWYATTTTGAPANRDDHCAVWTGSVMVVWGGDLGGGTFANTGGKYDPGTGPGTDSWTGSTTTVNAPTARFGPRAAWTGSRVFVWSGTNPGNTIYYNTGGLYDPVGDSWTTTSVDGAPAGRMNPSCVWTGSRILIWGGDSATPAHGDGALYDLATNAWTPMSSAGAPTARTRHGIAQTVPGVWTGTNLLVWGGWDGGATVGTGASYNPATDSWTALAATGAPAARSDHVAAWCGDRMVVWSGTTDGLSSGLTTTGSRYSPVGVVLYPYQK
ncbi:MAG: hypothetical protein HYY93_07305 [Planctomycetes bacterium]|nr:hypothetical protein [Planctomycetota bacterium]